MQSNTVLVSNNTLNEDSQLNEKYPSEGWLSWAVTDVGKQRERNEDAVLNRPETGLWAIADGMGGHHAGDVASDLVVSALENIVYMDNLEVNIGKVANCLQSVNADLRDLADQSRNDIIIGSTVVVLIARQRRCAVLWAGDSRLYRLRNQQLQQLTEDHCPDDVNVANAWSVKSSNEITRAVGADEKLELDCKIIDICDNDLFLLCSDGLDREVSAKEIEQIMLSNAPEKIVDVLLELALQRGAGDNISIVLAIPTTG